MKYAVMDIETTGGNFNEEGITEIAIHLFDGLHVIDSFISLINPEKEIQPFVVQLTGINKLSEKKRGHGFRVRSDGKQGLCVDPIWLAKRMRWLSPPDKVPALRDSVR